MKKGNRNMSKANGNMNKGYINSSTCLITSICKHQNGKHGDKNTSRVLDIAAKYATHPTSHSTFITEHMNAEDKNTSQTLQFYAENATAHSMSLVRYQATELSTTGCCRWRRDLWF